MTWTVYFSGVHGSGKTTIRTRVTQRLQKAGMSVYAFPEFSYIPDIPIGTPEFQLWYRTQLRIRQELIQYLVNTKYFDIILVDRHPIDEKVYAERLGGDKCFTYIMYNKSIHIFIDRPIKDIVKSLSKRMELEDHQHRKNWNETDTDYLNKINNTFKQVYEQAKNPSTSGSEEFIVRDEVQTLINTDLNEAIDEALRIIMRCIK